MKTVLEISKKQKEILKVLNDKKHTEIFIGGSAGGSKSFTGCLWIVTSCLKYPGSRWFLARARLKSLKESTLLTFFEVCKLLKITQGNGYHYNPITGVVKFANDSEVYLRDLFLYPSDSEFTALGSTEYTGGFIDEMGEITSQAYNIIRSRIRFKLTQFNLIPKLLMGSNPCKTFIYGDFYKKWSLGTLEHYKAYIPASVYDNPYISPHYIENLKKLDPVNRERLLNGNWEYSTDAGQLIQQEKLYDIFLNEHVPEGNKHLTSDLAMMGRDKFVIMSWSGMRCTIELIKDRANGKEIEMDLRSAMKKYQVSHSDVVVDADGMGNYIESYLNGIREFRGGSSAFNKELYPNLKTECGFKLAEVINKGQMFINTKDEDLKSHIIQELEQLKRDKIDDDTGKLCLIKKDVIKSNLGRSPDLLDCLFMRMIFESGESYSFLEDPEGLIL